MSATPKTAAVAIAGTFTVDPLVPVIDFWRDELGHLGTVRLGGYNRIFQDLLDPESALRRNRSGLNVILFRIEDLLPGLGDASAASRLEQLSRLDAELTAALADASRESGATTLILACEASPAAYATLGADFIASAETQLVAAARRLQGVHGMTAGELGERYPVTDYSMPAGDGDTPYTHAYYTALGTMIARYALALFAPPAKVIAVDCDNTLWTGVCGEDGVEGVTFETSRRSLQALLVEQQRAGRLLCLCSKNEDADVIRVFSERASEMPLKLEHVVSRRVNWQPKSDNLRELSAELGVGIDSFVFIDDSPIECAEVRSSVPEAMVLQISPDPDQAVRQLRHHWALDTFAVTGEDSKRTAMYRSNVERERLRTSATNLGDFINNLGLVVEFRPLTASSLARASQLTMRTNQFNSSTLRRTEGELRPLLDGDLSFVVHVADRFGDYGLVGFCSYVVDGQDLRVTGMLLSCRALGRGVEHRMVARLGDVAGAVGAKRVCFDVTTTERNTPARSFLYAIGCEGQLDPAGHGILSLPTETAAELVYDANRGATDDGVTDEPAVPPPRTGGRGHRGAKLAHIAESLQTVTVIGERIRAGSQRLRSIQGQARAPRNRLEGQLCALLKREVNVDEVGIDDDFRELGGSSVHAAMITAQLQKELGEIVHLTVVYDAPTVAQLADYLAANYPKGVARWTAAPSADPARSSPTRVTDADFDDFANKLASAHVGRSTPSNRKPPAVFLLSPPRCGSTLLRVMLAGHPRLFAPPELELMSFETMREWREEFAGRNALHKEGMIRAWMELRACSADEARAEVDRMCEEGVPVADAIGRMQELLGDRLLVEKTPSNSLYDETLQRIESSFDRALYIHLSRNPLGMIKSFHEARLNQIFFRHEHSWQPRQLAELVWHRCEQNIRSFLERVPAARVHHLRFEQLVEDPEAEMRALCAWLGIEPSESMWNPYQDLEGRMTDGLRTESRMLGDVKFLGHRRIDPSVASAWKSDGVAHELNSRTVRLATDLGFEPGPLQPIGQALSSAQAFTLDLIAGGARPHMRACVRLRGLLDFEALQGALDAVVDRHEALRTSFRTTPPPGRVLHERVEVRLERESLDEGVNWEGSAVAARLEALRSEPFDLERGPLLRVNVLSSGPHDHLWVMVIHHIICDGHSMEVLLRDISREYDARRRGTSRRLARAPSFSEYVARERAVAPSIRAQQEAYWKALLTRDPVIIGGEVADIGPVYELLSRADDELLRGVDQVARAERTTPFVVLLAVIGCWVRSMQTSPGPFLVGYFSDDRKSSALDEAVGPCVKMLAYEVGGSSEDTWKQMIAATRTAIAISVANSDVVPADYVPAHPRNPSRRMAPVLVNQRRAPGSGLSFAGVAASPMRMPTLASRHDVEVDIAEHDDGTRVYCLFRQDRFTESEAVRLVRRLEEMIASCALHPERSVVVE